MVDPGTGITILGTAIGGAKVVEKILGPTAEYLGEGLKSWTEAQVNNVARIFRVADRHLGSDCEDGAVAPRLLKEVLFEGAFVDDPLMAEYYGGVLASGRSLDGGDDRGVALMKTVASMSRYEIKFHYLWYSAFRETFSDANINIEMGDELHKAWMFVSFADFLSCMELMTEDAAGAICSQTLTGLDRNGLLEEKLKGSQEFLNEQGKNSWDPKWQGASWIDVSSPGIVCAPTRSGADLYLWAMGAGNRVRREFFTGPLPSSMEEIQHLSDCVRSVRIEVKG